MEPTNKGRRYLSEKAIFFGVFLLYAILLVITLCRHEPWSDEAQAWLLARDASIPQLFTHYLRYEGTPCLWHLILMGPAKLHLPFFSIKIISGIIALVGVYIFLRFSPFPKWIKIIFPFSFFIMYQYAVVARSYVFFPTILFITACVFPKRYQRPYPFLMCLCLLASTSLHGTALAIGILAAYYWDVVKSWRKLSVKTQSQLGISGLFFLGLLAGIAYMLWLPADYYNRSYIGSKPIEVVLTRSLVIFGNALISDISFINGVPWFQIGLVIISLVIWYITFKWANYKGMARYLLFPGLALMALYGYSFVHPWHVGVLFVFWVFILWVCADHEPRISVRTESKNLVLALLGFVLLYQCYWTVNSLAFDWKYSYSGGAEAAHYIKTHKLEGKNLFAQGTFMTAVNAYFDHNIFANTPRKRAFVIWSHMECAPFLRYRSFIQEQPDLLILQSESIWGNYRVKSFLNYRFVGIFNGGIFWKDHIVWNETYLLFARERKRDGPATASDLQQVTKLFGLPGNQQLLIKNNGPIMGSY